MTPRSTLMLAILAKVLHLPIETLSVDGHFADQGLDSLTALRFAREVQEASGIEFDPEWLFDYPSIAELDRFLESRDAVSGKAAM